jgi:competence protein ComK
MKYLKRESQGILIMEEKEVYLKQGLKQYINKMCINNLSTYEGRREASKAILQRKSILPIYVNPQIFLYPTISVRNYQCTFINYYEVLSIIRMTEKRTKIVFNDLSDLNLDISHEKINNQHQRIENILNLKVN